MHIIRFGVVGGLAGLVLVMTSSWLITGGFFHKFQRLTPSTWRAENRRQHAVAVVCAVVGGGLLGGLESNIPSMHESLRSSIGLAILLWAALAAPVIATMGTYINLHTGVLIGLLLEWLVFVNGVSLACYCWAT